MHRLMISCHVRSVIPSQRGLMLMKALSKNFYIVLIFFILFTNLVVFHCMLLFLIFYLLFRQET